MTAFFEKSYKNTRTIKNTGFRKKSGVFLTFRNEIHARKIGVELALELAAKSAKIEYRENPTFSQ